MEYKESKLEMKLIQIKIIETEQERFRKEPLKDRNSKIFKNFFSKTLLFESENNRNILTTYK